MGMKKPKYRLIYQSSSNSSIFCPSALKLSIFVSHLSNMVMKKPIYRPFLSVIFQTWWWKSLKIDFFQKEHRATTENVPRKAQSWYSSYASVPARLTIHLCPKLPYVKKKKLVFDSLSLSPPPSLSSLCPSLFFFASIFLTMETNSLLQKKKKNTFTLLILCICLRKERKETSSHFQLE